MSEGAIRIESAGPVYYGSTHIRLRYTAHRDHGASETAEELERIARVDPHVRLRATRIACLEAQIRSSAHFESVRTELSFAAESNALRISVDVEARLSLGSAVGQKKTRGTRSR
jgi:hypothetical protein